MEKHAEAMLPASPPLPSSPPSVCIPARESARPVISRLCWHGAGRQPCSSCQLVNTPGPAVYPSAAPWVTSASKAGVWVSSWSREEVEEEEVEAWLEYSTDVTHTLLNLNSTGQLIGH